MSGNILCFIFGFSTGYIVKIVVKQKCSNTTYPQRRIQDIQLPSSPVGNNHLNSITLTQPQMAVPCHDNDIPLANTEAEQLNNYRS